MTCLTYSKTSQAGADPIMPKNFEKDGHIDKIRLIAATTSKFELEVRELRHIFRCRSCLELFLALRDPFRPKKEKELKRAA